MLSGYFAPATSELLVGGLGLAAIAHYTPTSLNVLMVGAYSLTVEQACIGVAKFRVLRAQ